MLAAQNLEPGFLRHLIDAILSSATSRVQDKHGNDIKALILQAASLHGTAA